MDYKNPLKMIDPLTGMEMTMQPPMPANQMGVAKPMFNQTAQGNKVWHLCKTNVYTVPVFMSAKQAKTNVYGSASGAKNIRVYEKSFKTREKVL